MPGGPKLGNTYPIIISSYPSWVAHITPYTAEWGNSVGFEFYSIEYTLGTNVQGTHLDVRRRFEDSEGRISAVENDYVKKSGGSFEGHVGFNYYRIEYSYIFSCAKLNFAGEGITVIGIKNEDDMSSDSDKHLATQKSIKDYIDLQLGFNYFTQIYLNVSQNNVAGKILFDTVKFDNGGQEDVANNQIKIKQEGWYWIILDLFIELQPQATDYCSMRVILYIGTIEKHYDNKYSSLQIFSGVHINTMVFCPVDTIIYAEAAVDDVGASGNIRQQSEMSRITVRQMRREY